MSPRSHDETPEGDQPTAGTVQAQEEADLVAAQHEAATVRTAREFGKNSVGEATLYPSDRESLERQHGLTSVEAEELWNRTVRGSETADTVVDDIKGARVHYRQTYDQVPDVVSPLAQADLRAALTDAEQAKVDTSTPETPTADPTQPEAGPYGPGADYRQVEVSTEEAARAAGLTPAQVDTLTAEGALPTTEG